MNDIKLIWESYQDGKFVYDCIQVMHRDAHDIIKSRNSQSIITYKGNRYKFIGPLDNKSNFSITLIWFDINTYDDKISVNDNLNSGNRFLAFKVNTKTNPRDVEIFYVEDNDIKVTAPEYTRISEGIYDDDTNIRGVYRLEKGEEHLKMDISTTHGGWLVYIDSNPLFIARQSSHTDHRDTIKEYVLKVNPTSDFAKKLKDKISESGFGGAWTQFAISLGAVRIVTERGGVLLQTRNGEEKIKGVNMVKYNAELHGYPLELETGVGRSRNLVTSAPPPRMYSEQSNVTSEDDKRLINQIIDRLIQSNSDILSNYKTAQPYLINRALEYINSPSNTVREYLRGVVRSRLKKLGLKSDRTQQPALPWQYMFQGKTLRQAVRDGDLDGFINYWKGEHTDYSLQGAVKEYFDKVIQDAWITPGHVDLDVWEVVRRMARTFSVVLKGKLSPKPMKTMASWQTFRNK